jgi:hypothetical protein
MFFIISSITLATHSFLGIKHDGALYFLQALHILNPNALMNDIFFLNGSQDQYTIFTKVYALILAFSTASFATFLLELVALNLWILAALYLFKGSLPLLPASIVTVLTITLDSYYGSHKVFSYAEPFLTARIYAEFFSLFALGFYIRKRYYTGSLMYAIALLFHPLITLPALFIGLGLILRIKSWLFLAVIGLIFGVILGLLNIHPFDGLVKTMDSEWFNYNQSRSPFVFLHTWSWEALSQFLFIGSICFYAFKILKNSQLKKLSLLIFISLLIFFLISYLGSSIFKIPLIISLQLHRILWISSVLSIFILGVLAWENFYKYSINTLIIFLLLSFLLVDKHLQGSYAFILVVCSLALAPIKDLHAKIAKKTFILVSLIMALPISFSVLNTLIDIGQTNFISEHTTYSIIMNQPMIASAITLIIYFLLSSSSRAVQCLTIFFALAFLLFNISKWSNSNIMDFQDSGEVYYDSAARQAAIQKVREIIPETSVVYWINEPRKTWFWLRRSNYVSFDQGAGSVFSRENTVELIKRAHLVKEVSDIDSETMWSIYSKYTPPLIPKLLTSSAALKICSDPALDFIITQHYSNDLQVKTFEDPLRKITYGLYTCPNHRENKNENNSKRNNKINYS